MTEHWLHVYQRPVQGNAFIKRFPAYRYRHKIAAVGGYDTAGCDLAVGRVEAERFVRDYLGCRVAVFADNPALPIWEGFVNRATYSAGSVVYTRSLDKLYNRVSGIYDNGGTTTQITAINNLTSQAIYGIKEGSPDMGKMVSTATALNTYRDRVLSRQSYPAASIAFSDRGGAPTLSLELKGFYWWLEWAKYVNTSTTNTAMSTILSNMISSYPNTSFFNVSGSVITTNTLTRRPNQLRVSHSTYWDIVKTIQEKGDGTNAFVAGITPTQQNGTRYFYYRQANTDIEYILKTTDGKVRNTFGHIVKPWLVQPDRIARINDILIGQYADDLRDPRLLYLDVVEYNADGYGVQMASADNLTAEGAFQLRFRFKFIGDRFGSEKRIV